MVDYFSLGITHLLMALAAWRLLLRDDLDQDPAAGASGEPAGEPALGEPAGRA